MFYKRLGYFLLGVGVTSVFLKVNPMLSFLALSLGIVSLYTHNLLLSRKTFDITRSHDTNKKDDALTMLANAIREVNENNDD